MAMLIIPALAFFLTACPLLENDDDGDKNSWSGTTSSTVVDTAQTRCFDSSGSQISCPGSGSDFLGQDAQYLGLEPDYTNNNDDTITDNNTGLMWEKDPGSKMTYEEALAAASSCRTGGYSDWRLPSIKELYSLIIFSGLDPSGWEGTDTSSLIPFIDTGYFDFEYGDTSANERIIDAQYASSTKYAGLTMGDDETLFGVNFADGRIKGYGLEDPAGNGEKEFFVIFVRGNEYLVNNYTDNEDGTISDSATGLMWMQEDSGHQGAGDSANGKLNWEQALEWAENLEYAGYSDWRLPNAKELQSIVDYSRSPSTTGSAAIDPLFSTSSIADEGGSDNFPFYWTSTTHENMVNGANAVYIAFGEALGWMRDPDTGEYELMDVHGAGAQRSDPKVGDPDDYPYGHGPQGDVIRIYNFVRCVRDI
ncbi:MAG: DUF1566 domain-containing protein [bacterium]|nr:DUF1566 domain-containing protein [bacterium]